MESKPRAIRLATAIQQTYKKSTFPLGRNEHYSPEKSLKSIITQTYIEEALTIPGLVPEPPEKELVDFILRKAAKLFALSLIIDFKGRKLRTAMASFASNGICDQDLPIDRQALEESPRFSCCRNSIWTSFKRDSVLHYQWYFLAPRFPTGGAIERMQLHSSIIFPIELADQRPPRGAFGAVWKAKIHPSHFGHGQVRIRYNSPSNTRAI